MTGISTLCKKLKVYIYPDRIYKNNIKNVLIYKKIWYFSFPYILQLYKDIVYTYRGGTMSQRELSAIAEYGLQLIAMENETIDPDLILQYYTEKQLEWYARSMISERYLSGITLEDVRINWKNYVDTYTEQFVPSVVRLEERLAKKGIFIIF